MKLYRGLSIALAILVVGIIFSVLPGCSHGGLNGFDPAAEKNMPVIFGVFKVSQSGKDVTENTVVHFSDEQTYTLSRNGFLALYVPPGSVTRVKKLMIAGNEYPITNLAMKAGPSKTKNYIGNIQLSITAENYGVAEERWTWKVTNEWKQAWGYWNKMFKGDKRKTFSSLARRIGPDREQTRGVASDRVEVAPGF